MPSQNYTETYDHNHNHECCFLTLSNDWQQNEPVRHETTAKATHAETNRRSWKCIPAPSEVI